MTTLIESRTNRLGIEVTHARERSTEKLRAYRNGELVATRLVERRAGRAIGDCIVLVDDVRLTREERGEISRALDEGVRILRDGRGLCEAA